MQSSFPHTPKLVSGGNFTPSPRRPPSPTAKTKASLQQELGKLHWVFTQLLVAGIRHWHLKGTFLWRRLNPLEGLWCRMPGLSSARVSLKRLLAPASRIVLDLYTAQEGTGTDPAPQQHFRSTTFTSAIKHQKSGCF